MAKIPFFLDLQVSELIYKSHGDAESAKEILKIAAKYLRNREVLPDNLADYIADAFEIAAHKRTPTARAKTLGHELNLTARNRRPKNEHWFENAMAYEEMKENKDPIRAIEATLSVRFQVSESTIRRIWKQYESARQKDDTF